MMGKARIAFRFGHYGDCFHGSQVQPDVPQYRELYARFQKEIEVDK